MLRSSPAANSYSDILRSGGCTVKPSSLHSCIKETIFSVRFMSAVLTADMDRTEKIVSLIQECKELGLTVQPPDLNISLYEFAAGDERSIRYGLGAVKGVGEAAVRAIIDERADRKSTRLNSSHLGISD